MDESTEEVSTENDTHFQLRRPKYSLRKRKQEVSIEQDRKQKRRGKSRSQEVLNWNVHQARQRNVRCKKYIFFTSK